MKEALFRLPFLVRAVERMSLMNQKLGEMRTITAEEAQGLGNTEQELLKEGTTTGMLRNNTERVVTNPIEGGHGVQEGTISKAKEKGPMAEVAILKEGVEKEEVDS
jgi:hypothetical protein